MFKNIVIIAMCLVMAVSSNNKCDNVKCDQVPIKHYKELGCVPVTENDECCPSRFQCTDKAKTSLNQCHWNGKVYNPNDELTLNETNSLCSAGCNCAEGYPKFGIPAEFVCANIQCAHFLECTQISTLDSCCPKHICDEDEMKALGTTTCVVDGKTYRVGEKMYPNSHQCYACICAENFDNTTIIGNPACNEINCGIELRNYADVHYGCIPNYYGTNTCCPVGWRCPRDDDVIIPSSKPSSVLADPKLQCQFGNLSLNIGDEIKSEHQCNKCKCVIPPMAHCVKTPNCKL